MEDVIGYAPNWEERRYELAKAVMQGFIMGVRSCGDCVITQEIIMSSIDMADEMINQLKK